MRAYLFASPGQEERFLDDATALNYKEVAFIYTKKTFLSLKKERKEKLVSKKNLKVLFGYSVQEKDEFIRPGEFDVKLQLGTKNALVFPHVTHIYGNELEEEKDFIHQRRSGLNHVLLKNCKAKQVEIVFDYVPLQKMGARRRAQVMGRMRQNILLCKKYDVAHCVLGIINTAEEMRDARDVKALQRVLE